MMYVEGLSVNFRKQSLEAVLESKVFLKCRQSPSNLTKIKSLTGLFQGFCLVFKSL